MSAYIIVEIDILDPTGYEEYKKLAGSGVLYSNFASSFGSVTGALQVKFSHT